MHTGLLPLRCQHAGHVLHGPAPFRQALLVGGGLGRMRLRDGLVQRSLQSARALLEGLRSRLQGGIEPRRLRLLGLFLAVQRCQPGIGHLAGSALPLAGERLHLRPGQFAQLRMRLPGFLRQGVHGLLDHRPDHLTGLAGAGLQTALQRGPHRAGQLGVGRRGLLVKRLLPLQQLVVQLPVAALQPVHQPLEVLCDQRQGLCLGLQGMEHFVATVRWRERPQHRGNADIEQAQRLQALAAAQRQQQTQHGRCGHPGHRGAERQPQPLDGRRQRGTDRLQVRRDLQRQHGPLEGHHHAQKSAQHAQHDQQPHQIRRQRRTRQRHARTLDPLAHRPAQRRGQALQPCAQVRQRLRHVGQRGRQGRCRCAKPHQLRSTQHIHPAHQHCHRQRQRARPHEPPGHPAHRRQTGTENAGHHTLLHSCLPVLVVGCFQQTHDRL